MKLRLKGNSLRVRLTRQETARLASEGWVENETDFGRQKFRFAVAARAEALVISAEFVAQSIVVTTPAAAATEWAEGSAVGLYGEQPLEAGGVLTIAIEKDFRCLDPGRDEDESDHFDNPLAGQSHREACAHED